MYVINGDLLEREFLAAWTHNVLYCRLIENTIAFLARCPRQGSLGSPMSSLFAVLRNFSRLLNRTIENISSCMVL